MSHAARISALALALVAPALGGHAAERYSLGATGGYFDLSSAAQSAAAVFGGARGGATFGGDLRIGLTRSLFVTAGARTFTKKGERVFVADASSPVFPLGHPLDIRLTPIFGHVGWRFRPDARLVPYVALGGGVTLYDETSTVAGVTESESATRGTWHVAGGADYAFGHVGLGLEARWSSVPNAIGLGGVSKVYGETDLGGFSVVARISYRR